MNKVKNFITLAILIIGHISIVCASVKNEKDKVIDQIYTLNNTHSELKNKLQTSFPCNINLYRCYKI